VQLFRCYGGKITGSVAADLDAANLRARKGDMLGALQGYQKILEQVPFAAGVKYNLALALLQQNETKRAAESLELVLVDCANYAPAYSILSGCYEHLGEEAKLKELRRVWGDDDTDEQDEPTLDDDAAEMGGPPRMLDEDDVWA
jgi:predicted Zn-dependent protease